MKTLLLQAFAGMLFLLLIMALALFLPAGTLDFWQAWVYLGVFAVCTILITAYLIKYDPQLLAGRVQAGPLAERQRSQQIIQGLASLFFLGIYVVAGLDARLHWSSVPPGLCGVADGLVALGFFVVFLVFRENRYTRATIEVSEEQTVITTGPYHVVRHPMYAGALLLMLATPPALGSWAALPCVVPLLLVIVIRLLEEEQYLVAHLPGYAEYCRQVRFRLVPFVW